ncbi:MAG TPA: hypothetical protein VEL02_10300 [Jatrophihabitantaceae bacterium]|nr:hypothetical protein [Jatrophihabitantaceae bacterium]
MEGPHPILTDKCKQRAYRHAAYGWLWPEFRLEFASPRAGKDCPGIYKNFNRWAQAGVWARVLEKVQSLAHQAGDLDWVASIDSTIVRVHQHGACLPRVTGGFIELQEVRTGAA